MKRDRGLSAAESIEFELWLAADPRHVAAMKRTAGAWSLLDRVSDQFAQQDLQHLKRRRRLWRHALVTASLAAAAVLVFGILASKRNVNRPALDVASARPVATGPRTRMLADGTFVQLNSGAEIIEQYSSGERGVRLVRGEAHFSVAKNPAWPFIVHVGSVEVRAVGTAFDVQLQSAAVEVLVTEGVVKLSPPGEAALSLASTDTIPLLQPGQRAVVALKPVSPGVAVVVTQVSREEIWRTLAWQEPLLRLDGATLAEVATAFEHRTGRRVILADPALAGLRLGGRFRADDIDGFADLMATTFDVDVERAVDGALVLRKKIQVRDSGN